MDGSKSYIVYPFAVTGFDAQNVLVACDRYYDGSDSAMVLKWNGSAWIDVPYIDKKRANGGLGWIVSQTGNKAWAVSAAGLVVKYENGLLSTDPKFMENKINDQYFIAPLDNGEVYANSLRDSLQGETIQGAITKLFYRDFNGNWSLLESKFMAGADYDGNGLGRGILSVGNKLFTDNRGLWEKTGSNWVRLMSIYGIGGECLIAENNIWVYFRHEIWQFNSENWLQVQIPILENYPGSFLYSQGWSDGNEIFLSLHHNGKTYIVHGK
jgi:hypothetical protein